MSLPIGTIARHWVRSVPAVLFFAAAFTGCAFSPDVIPESRFQGPEDLFQTVAANVARHPEFEVIADIDRARLVAKAGSPMPPPRAS